MRIFLAGASGVIGQRVVPLLVARGHEVAGMTRSPGKRDALRALGAEPVVCDACDPDALRAAVVAFGPDLVMHQLTDLPDDVSLVAAGAAANARIRREGTANLLAAARAAGAHHFLAQSVAWELAGDSGAAKEYLEQSVVDAGGVVLRYGRFYGPGTYYEADPPEPPRVHVDDAASRTIELLDGEPGIHDVVET